LSEKGHVKLGILADEKALTAFPCIRERSWEDLVEVWENTEKTGVKGKREVQ